jgi:hypothetical protein
MAGVAYDHFIELSEEMEDITASGLMMAERRRLEIRRALSSSSTTKNLDNELGMEALRYAA